MEQKLPIEQQAGATIAEADSRFVANLIFHLRDHGYAADTRHAVACENLLHALRQDGKRPTTNLADYLGPIFCRTAEEQRQFRKILELLPESTKASRRPHAKSPATELAAPDRWPSRWVAFFQEFPRLCSASAIALVVVLGVVATLMIIRPVNLSLGNKPISGGDGAGKSEKTGTSVPPSPALAREDMARVGDQAGLLSYRRILVREPERRHSLATWAIVTLPWLGVGVWLLRGWWTVPRLRRETTPLPDSLKQVVLPGGNRNAFTHLGVRELGRSLRVRQTVPSRELNVDASIQRTTRNGGLPTLVFESRAEPAYLILVDRRGGSDHFSHLVDSLLESLLQANVMMEVFNYDGDPTFCEVDGRFAPRSRIVAQRMQLADLLNRWPDRQLVFVGDGAEFRQRFANEPAGWIKSMGDRRRVLVTPTFGDVTGSALDNQAPRHPKTTPINVREARLQQLGFQIIPLTQSGLRELPAALGVRDMRHQGKHRELYAFEREPLRCVSRFKPPPTFVATLLKELREYLGSQGFLWLAAIAAYPEIHYGLTLRLGASLMASESQWEALLPRLSQLVWLRRGFMPDWFRETLLNGLESSQVKLIQQVLNRLLEEADEKSSQPDTEQKVVRLRIAVDPPRTLFERWNRWWRQREAAKRESEQQTGDFVYLRFLSRGSGWLEPLVNRRLLHLLFPNGVGLLGLRPLAFCVLGAAVSLCAYGGADWWQTRGSRIESITMNAGGQQIVTTHPGGVTRIWSGLGPTLVSSWGQDDGGATNDIRSISIGPTGAMLVLQTHDTVTFWNRLTGKSWMQRWTPVGRGASELRSAFSEDGMTCVVAASTPAASQCWIYRESGGSEAFNVASLEVIRDVAVRADGQTVVLADSRRVVEYDPRSLKVIAEFLAPDGLDFEKLVETKDKSWIAGPGKGTFEIWDWRRGVRHSSYPASPSEQVNYVPSADGQFVVSADGSVVIHQRTSQDLEIRETATGQLVEFGERIKALFPPNGIRVTADGQSFFTADDTGALCWWDAKTAKPIGSSFRPVYDSTFMSVSPHDERPPWHIHSLRNGSQLWNVTTGTPFGAELPELSLASESACSISADGKWLASAEGDRVFVWSLAEADSAPPWTTTGSLLGVSDNGRRAAIAQRDGSITIRSLSDANRELGAATSKTRGGLAMLTPDGSEIASMSNLGRFEWLDVATGASRDDGADTVGGSTDGILGAVWGASGSLLRWNARLALLSHPDKPPEEFGLDWAANRHVQSASRRYVLLWNDQTSPGKVVLIDTWQESDVLIPMSSRRVVGAAFSPDDERLACWNEEGEILVHRVSQIAPSTDSLIANVSVPSTPLRCVGLSRGGTTLVVLDREGELSFHEVTPKLNNNNSPGDSNDPRPFRTSTGISSVAQGTGDVLAVVDQNGRVRLLDARSGAPLSDYLPTSSRVTQATFGRPAAEDSDADRSRTAPAKADPPKPSETKKSEAAPELPIVDPPKSDIRRQESLKTKAFYSPRERKSKGDRWLDVLREETSFVAWQSATSAPGKDDLPNVPPAEGDAESAESRDRKPAYREQLALALDHGGIELWQLDLAGRGAALLVVGRQNNSQISRDRAERELRRTADLLTQRFGFEVELLTLPSKAELANAMAKLEARLTPDDRLVVVLAGLADKVNDQYHFAAGANDEDLLSANEIREFMDRTWARQSLLVVQSSYSGMLLASDKAHLSSSVRSNEQDRVARFPEQSPWGPRARVVITASGPDDHSWADATSSKLITPFNQLLESDSGIFAGPFSSGALFDVLKKKVEPKDAPTANGPIHLGRLENTNASPQAEFYFPSPLPTLESNNNRKPVPTN
ncbi:MAG: caspase family protein [Pirellulales bacterium]